jgi:hypothetical protein
MMAAAAGLKDIVRMYPFNELQPNAEGIALVDVGGGKGHVMGAVLAAHSPMKGKVVLQDLKSVLDGGTVVAENENVVLQPYDFFKEIQPVKGKFIMANVIQYAVQGRLLGCTSRKLTKSQEQTTSSDRFCTTGPTRPV